MPSYLAGGRNSILPFFLRAVENGEPYEERKEKLERIANLCVGAAMCLSGVTMLFIALFSADTEKGNVIPGLIIADWV